MHKNTDTRHAHWHTPSSLPCTKEFKSLFLVELGCTNITQYIIDTGNALPTKVPPRPILFYYAERVHQQLQEMAQEGIICPSTSPWCAPEVYVPKSSGEIRICVNYVQLNCVTKKDSYTVLHAEGPQQKLASKRVFFSNLTFKVPIGSFPWSQSQWRKLPLPGARLWTLGVH